MFLNEVRYGELPEDVVDATKKRLLDSVGIALVAVGDPATDSVLETVCVEGGEKCSLWARSETASLSGAAFYNTARVRYLDFMDSFLVPGEPPIRATTWASRWRPPNTPIRPARSCWPPSRPPTSCRGNWLGMPRS